MGTVGFTMALIGIIILLSPFLRTRKRHLKGWNWIEILAEGIGWILELVFYIFFYAIL